jgi:acetoin utilization deacetylase AcuC-like enzyme
MWRWQGGMLSLLLGVSIAGILSVAAEPRVMSNPSTTRPTGLVYHPDFLLHDPGPDHPERPARLQAMMAHLKRRGLLDTLLVLDAEPASEQWITRVHTPAYLRQLQSAVRHAPTALDADTRVSKQSYDVVRRAVGGVLAAVDAVMAGRTTNAFAALRPPGHHALADRAMGFCLLNHVAIATRYVQEQHGVERVLIVDWDVHHGNATQEAFYRDPSVLFFSTHQYPYYPGTGAAHEVGEGAGHGTTINVPLAAESGDAAMVKAFRERLLPAATAFRPQFVLISAGFDAHRSDPLAQLQVTEAGYATLTRIVKTIADQHADGRIVSVLEGGYHLEGLARSVEAHLRVLAGR